MAKFPDTKGLVITGYCIRHFGPEKSGRRLGRRFGRRYCRRKLRFNTADVTVTAGGMRSFADSTSLRIGKEVVVTAILCERVAATNGCISVLEFN